MRQQSLEVLRECPRVEHLVLASPNYQRRQLRLCELRLEPGKAGQCASVLIERNPAGPHPGQKPSLGVRQDCVIGGEGLAAEFVTIDDRQIDAAAGQNVVAPEEIGSDQWRVHDPPRKQPGVEFGGRP